MKERGMAKRVLFVAAFFVILHWVYCRCCHYDAWGFNIHGEGMDYISLFVFQAVLTFSAVKAFFVNMPNRNLALAVNTAISTVLMMWMFKDEVLSQFPADVEFASVMKEILNGILNPEIWLMHIGYAVLIYVVFKYVFKGIAAWWPRNTRETPETA